MIVPKSQATEWDMRFLGLAEHVAGWSKDPSTKTGAVIVRPDKTICSVGYNGFPRNMADFPDRYAHREEKYARILHCEMNAVFNAKEPVAGYTLYTWPFLSCQRCAVHVIQAGIVRTVAPCPTAEKLERWAQALEQSRDYFIECGVVVVEIEGLVS